MKKIILFIVFFTSVNLYSQRGLEDNNENPIVIIDPNPIDPNPIDPNPIDPNPIDPNPIDPNPIDPNPIDPNPIDPNPIDPTTGNNVLTPFTNTNEVGITQGNLSVSLTGAASYNIPIVLPPGINNVAPNISLNYTSQSGDGNVGYGWNIGGISKISRVPSTLYHDGIIDLVDFDNYDRFSLDGQRLILKSGTYGFTGSTYETENFSNLKISFLANGFQSYFKVEYPDGSIALYGYSNETSSMLSLSEWPITQWKNPQNISVNYKYFNYNNELHIKSIDFGTNTNIGINKVEFTYKTKNKETIYYIESLEYKNNKILSQINITGNGVPFKNYYLTHDLNSTGHERLKSIQEKTGDNSKSLNPTVFYYKQNQNSFSQQIAYSHKGVSLNSNSFFPASHFQINDYFGNGEKVINSISPKFYTVNEDYTINTYNNKIGGFALRILNSDNKLSNAFLATYDWVNNNINGTRTIKLYSYNKNIGSSVLEYEKNFIPSFTSFSNSESSTNCSDGQKMETNFFEDFNGDKLTDVVLVKLKDGILNTQFVDLDRRLLNNFSHNSGDINVGVISNCTNIYEANGATAIKVGEFNNDGKMDLFIFRGQPYNKIDIYTLENNTFVLISSFSYNLNVNLLNSNEYPIIIGDYNGDGKSDVLFPWQKKILYSTGNSSGFIIETLPSTFKTPSSTYPTSVTYYQRASYFALDIDNDGKSDIVRLDDIDGHNESGIEIDIYSKNNGWQNASIIKLFGDPQNGAYNNPYDPNNYNRFNQTLIPLFVRKNELNNKFELAILGEKGISYFNIIQHFEYQNLLVNVTNGNGVVNNIIYKDLLDSNGTFIKSNNLENYPYFNVLNAKNFKVVSEIRKTFLGYQKKKLFKYYGALFDVSGRGINGFQATLHTNWFDQTSDVISTINKFNFTKNGAPTEIFSVLGLAEPTTDLPQSASFISKTIITYNHEDTAYVNPLLSNKVFKLFKTKTQNYNGLDGTSNETSIAYNNYNNPIQTTTTIKNGTTIEQTSTTTLSYDSLMNSPYMVDRVNGKFNTTTIFPSNNTTTSQEIYSYDVNLLTQIQKKGHNTVFITEDNEYDSYGNIIKKTLSAPGLANRESEFEYDTQTHRFITKKIDIEDLETVYTYDLSTGNLLTETLPSKSGFPLKNTYLYDKWGKKTRTIDYLGKFEDYTYQNIFSGGVIVTSTKKTSKFDYSSSKTILDPLGRTIHEGFRNIDDSWSIKSTFYDINDKPTKISQPYLDTSNGFEVWNEMQYDVYGRLIQSNALKTNGQSGKVTTYNYTGLTTTENDGQKTKTTLKNALGNVISLTESPGTQMNYDYFADGNLKSSNSSGATTSFTYDGWGRKIQMVDPSAGTYNYTYNHFGETLAEEIVGKGITEYDLDNFGKVSEKRIKENGILKSKCTYTYDSTHKYLNQIRIDDYGNGNYTINNYGYDDYKRLNFKDESGFQAYFQQAIQYDAFGRPLKELYSATNTSNMKSSSKWIRNEYKNGYKKKIFDDATNLLLWETNTLNANGDILTAIMGNGISISNTHDVYGFPNEIKHKKDLNEIMVLNTTFDPIYRNLTSRTSNLFGTWNETLTYDPLDRLTSYKDVEGVQNQNYNDNGTISNNNIGDYAYTIVGKPFQVSTITPQQPSAVFDYYNTREQNITYNLFKSPITITEQNQENIDFEYNAFNGRSTMYYGGLQTTKTQRPLRKFYSADGIMEIKLNNSSTPSTEFITYIGGDGYTAPIVLKSDGSTQNYFYLHRDYQGSILAITNDIGIVVEKRMFDVWGSLIQYANNAGVTTVPTTTNSMFLDRGYTGHEHLLGVGLINMNGRVYDNKLHRFLQPDNNIQDPYNTQNYNRYAYVMNNPTKYTDPTGEFWDIFLGMLFQSYAAGVNASGGQLNPFNWNSNGWTNAALNAASTGTSIAATNYANNFINDYGHTNIKYEGKNTQNEIEKHSYTYNNSAFAFAITTTGVLVADDVTVIGVVDDVAIPFIWAGATALWTYENRWAIVKTSLDVQDYVQESLDPKGFKYVTYTKTNSEGLVYVGRTSGYGSPEQIVKKRDYNHHMSLPENGTFGEAKVSNYIPATIDEGYGKRLLDPSYWTIRGSEQLQIEYYRSKGISGNNRNGIGPKNKWLDTFIEWGSKIF